MNVSVLERHSQDHQVLSSVTTTLRGRTLVLGSLLVVFSLGLTWFMYVQLARASHDVQTIATDSVPSVDAAESLAALLQGLDASAADYLSAAGLHELHPCILPGESTHIGMLTNHDCDAQAIPRSMQLVNDQMYLAIRNVTYPGEKTALLHAQNGLELYLADISRMQENYEQGANPSPHQYSDLQRAYADYLAAEDVLTQQISPEQLPAYETTVSLPSCTLPGTRQTESAAVWTQGSLQTQVRCLAAINQVHLQQAYSDSLTFLVESSLVVSIASLFVVLLLVITLARIIRLSRRRIHVQLSLVVLLALGGCVYGCTTLFSLAGGTGAFHRMVISDRVSIDAAARIRDYGTAANADESRYLIAENFNDASAIARWQDDWNKNSAQVMVDMQVAKKNMTYHPAEDNAYAGMEHWWSEYLQQDTNIRSSIKNSNPQDPNRALPAQEISTGISDQDFGSFLDATNRLARVNQDDYTQTLTGVQNLLDHAALLVLILLPLSGFDAFVRSLLFALREL